MMGTQAVPDRDKWRLEDIPTNAGHAVRDYLAHLDDAAFGAATTVTPKFVSPSDPAAQWTGAQRGPVADLVEHTMSSCSPPRPRT